MVAGKPHLGTERLVRILKAFRHHLLTLGVDLRFGSTVEDLVVEHGRCVGVRLKGGPHGDGDGGGGAGAKEGRSWGGGGASVCWDAQLGQVCVGEA